ncbi:MAG: hypothetical protein AAF192_15680, partial [Pseudomonadota bacterium]
RSGPGRRRGGPRRLPSSAPWFSRGGRGFGHDGLEGSGPCGETAGGQRQLLEEATVSLGRLPDHVLGHNLLVTERRERRLADLETGGSGVLNDRTDRLVARMDRVDAVKSPDDPPGPRDFGPGEPGDGERGLLPAPPFGPTARRQAFRRLRRNEMSCSTMPWP